MVAIWTFIVSEFIYTVIFCIIFYLLEIMCLKENGKEYIMDNQDTIHLLKKCNAGAKTAVNSIQEVIEHIQDYKLRQRLLDSMAEHEKLGDEAHKLLSQYDAEEKDPTTMARAMSWMKINMKLMMEESDKTVADLMTDGCGMGIKSLCADKNEYSQADHKAVQLADKLVEIEEKLVEDLKQWL